MTTCTPIYQLPCVEVTDRPCDIDTTSCEYAEAVEEQLDALDDIVAGTQGTVPFAYVANSGDMTYNNSILLFIPFFATTLADTDNMVNLAADNTAIYINTPGVYSFFVSAEITLPPGASTLQVSPVLLNVNDSQVSGNTDYFIGNFSASSSMPVKNTLGRLDNSCFTAEWIWNANAGDRYMVEIAVGGSLGINTTIHELRIGAVWLRGSL